MRLLSLVLVTSLLVLPAFTPAFAKKGGGCYSTAEAEAEQGIRIHSELMVIGLNCQHMTPRGWKNFYQQYREMTDRNADLFAGYEETLINYYNRIGDKNPEGRLHGLRTAMANKVSTDAARMRPDIFCATFSPRIPKAAKMSSDDFRHWASSTFRGEHSICEN